MKRIALCWLVMVSVMPLGAAQGEPPRRDGASSADSRWPEPRVYHFDISSANEHSANDYYADEADEAAAEPGPRMSGYLPTLRETSVRPAMATRSIQPPVVVAPEETVIDAAQGVPPPLPDDALPAPYDDAAPLWGPGPLVGIGLGGIPNFTSCHCPRHWGDPWANYCYERWWWHYGLMHQTILHQTPADLGEGATSCCGTCHRASQGATREAPMPPGELPAIVPDQAIQEDEDRQISTQEERPRPSKRRPPRNELPKQP
jgi:hypothetical protein